MIRTLGFYQPFCSLMLYGKLETRWIRVGKKPPFPLGKYLLYSTKKRCSPEDLFNWCGTKISFHIKSRLLTERTDVLDGYALAIGDLIKVRPMVKEDEERAFVLFKGEIPRVVPKGEKVFYYVQWILEFENVQRIEPFRFKGKQGVGIYKGEYKIAIDGSERY
jgi:hypothetical protein